MNRIHDHIRSNLVAWVALFFALAGTGVAASRYLITSTSQIKPSVLRHLRGEAVRAAVAGVPNGPKAVIARIRLSGGPVNLPTEETSIPITGATWTQAAGQVNAVTAQATATSSYEHCSKGGGRLRIAVDGQTKPGYNGNAIIEPFPSESTVTYGFEWEEPGTRGYAGTDWLLEPSNPVTHTIEVSGFAGGCEPGYPVTLDSIEIDVLAVR